MSETFIVGRKAALQLLLQQNAEILATQQILMTRTETLMQLSTATQTNLAKIGDDLTAIKTGIQSIKDASDAVIASKDHTIEVITAELSAANALTADVQAKLDAELQQDTDLEAELQAAFAPVVAKADETASSVTAPAVPPAVPDPSVPVA